MKASRVKMKILSKENVKTSSKAKYLAAENTKSVIIVRRKKEDYIL